MKNKTVGNIKDTILLGVLVASCIVLSPILITLFLFDDFSEENHYKKFL